MGNILLPSHKPLRISVPKFDDPKVEAWAKELESQLNRILVRDIEENRQRIELGLSDGTKDIMVKNISLPNCSRVQARRITAQSMANAAYTTVIFATEDIDTLGEYDNATGIFTATEEGSYSVAWGVMSVSAAWAAAEYWKALLSVDNSEADGGLYAGFEDSADAAVTGYQHSTGHAIVYLTAGQTLRIKLYHNQGAAVNCHASGIYNYFHIHKIS